MILNRYTIGAGIAVILIVSVIVGLKRWEANIRADVREEVAAEQLAEDLAQAQADAEALEIKVKEGEAAIAELIRVNAETAGRVRTVYTTIESQVADGSLANGQIDPIKTETMNQIETLEKEALEAEQ